MKEAIIFYGLFPSGIGAGYAVLYIISMIYGAV